MGSAGLSFAKQDNACRSIGTTVWSRYCLVGRDCTSTRFFGIPDRSPSLSIPIVFCNTKRDTYEWLNTSNLFHKQTYGLGVCPTTTQWDTPRRSALFCLYCFFFNARVSLCRCWKTSTLYQQRPRRRSSSLRRSSVTIIIDRTPPSANNELTS